MEVSETAHVTRTVKLSANLPREAFEVLQELSVERGSTMTDALKAAIATERYIRDANKRGGKILVEESDGRVYEVVFR